MRRNGFFSSSERCKKKSTEAWFGGVAFFFKGLYRRNRPGEVFFQVDDWSENGVKGTEHLFCQIL